MASRTDIQHHFGRVQAENIKLAGSPVSLGEWVQTKAVLTGGTLGGGSAATNILRYTVIGKTCIATYKLSQTVAGTASGPLRLSLPLRAASDQMTSGSGMIVSNASGSAVLTTTSFDPFSLNLFVTSNAAGPSLVSDSAFGLDDNTSWSLSLTIAYELF